ncbi:tyrosine-type recombinase/integrase [Dictyobacter aurantiacus]|uniref:Site-specific integrase n=1 Tax=Dictyobacter aurantiacus TaxID=1936993 RepID=A0A401ZBK5_9CHLR|nr:site-specific integrase [Dictyobacter aurantiacus]GCE04222.1 site-specific integrase [Dictyobacter aurantiacus]
MAKKRANGEGSIYQRKSDGKWVGSISTDDGKRKVFYGKTKAEVREKLNEAVYAQQRGMLSVGPNVALQEYLENWLENIHKPTIRLSTYLNYRKLLDNYLLPGLGKIKLQKLTPQQVQAFYSQKINEGLSPKTVNNVHGVLHKALDNAVKWNMLPRNICDAVTPPRIPRKELNYLTSDQARILLKEVKEHRLEALLTLAITTGMRRGELLALRWQDINFTDRSLQVRRAVSYLKNYGYVESEPKTARSRRTIMLPEFVISILQQHREHQQEQEALAGKVWVSKGLVFTNAWGDYYSPSTMLKVFKRFLESIDMPHMRFHDLRHSAATILLAMKVHPKIVQEILGHSQITTTMDIYSHAMPSLQDDATEQWEDKFGKKSKKKGKK